MDTPLYSLWRRLASLALILPARRETYVDPPAWHRYNAANGRIERNALFETSPIKFDDAEVVREFATSSDGTRVPPAFCAYPGLHQSDHRQTG
jgi:hypothetical protein